MQQSEPLTIWCNAKLPPAAHAELVRGVGSHRLILPAEASASNLVAGGPDPSLEDADIAFGQPNPQQVIELQRLRWVHLTSAGYTRYDNPTVRAALVARGAMLSNSSAVYEEPCAEHCLAMMLALARRLPQSLVDQQTTRRWRAAEHRIHSRLLVGQSVLIAGFGSIARRLVELLGPFRMEITCVRRTPRRDEGVRVVPTERILEHLPKADHVINILPQNAQTDGYFGAALFKAMKPGASFYNIGRGTTVDQDALLTALRLGEVAAAYLDVTDPEPLPPEHPLWTQPNCFITPHTAGGHEDEFERLVRHFLANLKRMLHGQSLVDRRI